MKRRLVGLTLVMFLLLLFSQYALAVDTVASGYCGEDAILTWTLVDGGTLTINGEGKMVSSMTQPWEQYKPLIKKVIIEDGVTVVGGWAFKDCTNLTDITLPESLTTIGYSSFENCTNLKSITLPSNVNQIAMKAFNSCTGLTDIIFSNALTAIQNYAFQYCSSLETMALPDSIKELGHGVFEGCSNLKNVTLPNGIEIITSSMFRDCVSLENVVIPDSVKTIEFSVFYNCTSLKDIVIPDSVTEIGSSIFMYCKGLEKVTLPETLSYIPDNLFYGCESLNDISLPNSIEIIGESAFSRCRSLESIVMPEGLKTVENEAFRECESLTNISFQDGLLDIGWMSFRDCTNLSDIELCDSITHIGNGAFWYTAYDSDEDNWENGALYISNYLVDARKFTEFEFSVRPGTVLIADQTFDNRRVTKLQLPESLVSIGNRAFSYTKGLTSITLPCNVKNVSTTAFSDSYITDIYVSDDNKNFKSIDGVLFTYDGTVLYTYPEAREDISYIVPNGVLSIGAFAFYDNDNLLDVKLPQGLTEIGESAFSYSDSLVCVILPDSVTSIGSNAFFLCGSLEVILMPDSVKSIDQGAFRGCPEFTDVYYTGTENEWKDIDIHYSNDSLEKAKIHYNAIGIPTPVINSEETEVINNNDGTYTVNVKLADIPHRCTLVAALYDASAFSGIGIARLQSSDTEKTITVTANDVKAVKIFIWNNLVGMKPLTDVIVKNYQ